MFLKGDRALSKLITLLISNEKEFNHFFKSRSSDIVLLKVGNLHQNVKRYVKRAMRMCERSEQIFINSMEVGNEIGSDHFPVIATLKCGKWRREGRRKEGVEKSKDGQIGSGKIKRIHGKDGRRNGSERR